MTKKFKAGVQEIIVAREVTHGFYPEQAALSQAFKKLLRNSKNWGCMTPQQHESLEMICVKMARICTGNPNTDDSWLDISGYSELARKSL